MKTFDGYSKEKFSDTSVLLAGGGSKELSNFIGTLNWDSTNRKLQYKKIGDTNWSDLVTFGSNATNSTAYLPLTGGTMTGVITSSFASSSWINGVTNAVIKGTYTGYGAILSMPVKDGRVSLSSYPGSNNNIYFGYATTALIKAGTNSFNKLMYWDAANNNLYADMFTGSLVGNASTATKLTSSAGSAVLPVYFSDGKPIACTAYSELLTALSSSAATNLSITVGGTTKSITNLYSGYLKIHDIRNTAHAPNATYYPEKLVTAWFNNTGTPTSAWHSGIHVKGWSNGYASWELCSYSSTETANNYNLYFRSGNNTTWGSWKTILDSSNYTSYVNNYYWANVKVSTSSNTATNPIFATATATTCITTPIVSSTGSLILNITSGSLEFQFSNDSNKSVIFNGTAFKPFESANGNIDLGSTSTRWKVIYGCSGDFIGDIVSTLSNNIITTDIRHKVQNSNGAVSILASTNRGLYDETNSAWIIYLTLAADHVYVPKWASIGSSTLPVYFNSSGEPVACTTDSGNSSLTISTCSTLDENSNNFKVEYIGGSKNINTRPSGVDAFGVMKLRTAAGWYGLILMSSNKATGIYYRTAQTLNASASWTKLLDSSNYTTFINFQGAAFRSGGLSDQEHNCNNATANGHYYYTANGPSGLGEQSTDGSLYVQSYSSSWVSQIALDYRNGNLWIRSRNNGNWQSWRIVCSLDTSKNLTIGGSFYANSDIRYKSIQTYLLNKVNLIAELPIFTYYWNDNLHDNKLHIGSSAQAVKEILPELVTYDELKDFYNLDYATLGTIAGITACKELVTLKSEIELLKERIKELEQQLKMINAYGKFNSD